MYKVISDFQDNLTEIIEQTSKKFEVLFYNNTLFLANLNINSNKAKDKKLIKKIIKEDCFILDIDDKNLKYEPDKVIEWCRDKFVEKETKKFEKEKQELLKAYVTLIKDLEIELKKEVEEGE